MEDPHPSSAEGAGLSVFELRDLLERGETTSTELVGSLLERIEAVDAGPGGLSSVLELSPDAADVAAERDAERRSGRVWGALHGVPVLLKDNIDTVAPLHTTAGSFVFGDGSPPSDAPVAAALREAGAIILGKANLSEWANFRSRPSSSGWSAVGGQTRNPHALDRSPGGSSSGSAAAVAARLAPAAVGTETDGSVLCPAAACGVMGLKPTVGLVSRTGIVPISASQDTSGPIARRVEDLALLLEVMARAVGDGEDELADPARRPPGYETRYSTLLGDGGLGGVRIGVMKGGGLTGYHPPTDRVVAAAIEAIGQAGAEVVGPIELAAPLLSEQDELVVLTHEFKAGAAQYFERRARAATEANGHPRTLEDVVAHAEQDPRERLDLFGLELVLDSLGAGGLGDAAYLKARADNHKRSRTDGLDRLFAEHRLDAVALPTMAPAWPIDHVLGDEYLGAGWSPPAVAGYPSSTIPVGTVGGLPVGLTLWGPAWSEAMLLRVMYAVEQALGVEVTAPRPAFAESVSIRV